MFAPVASNTGRSPFGPNWPMIRGIFTGTVRLDYARRRHPLWMAALEPPSAPPAPVEAPSEAAPESAPESLTVATEADLPPSPAEEAPVPPEDEPDGAART